MSELFSERHRAGIWRTLWIYLADEERKLGLPIRRDQIRALENAKTQIDFRKIHELEKQLKHDVMSHLKAFAQKAPSAEPILHLGATSAFITDNADAILFREATHLILQKLTAILGKLDELMVKYKNLTMTAFTHFQPAQPTTLGKRFALWAQDFLWDVEELEFSLERYQPLGCKGTTGTQASFLTLLRNQAAKVMKLDEGVCRRMGFNRSVALSGQTLSRKTDTWFLNALSNLASSFSKMSYDLRLLQHLREVMEPFGQNQVGSSAMPYKQNPMLAERMTGLARFLMNLAHNGPWTHATQWLERSLDDSSNRRIVIPEAFLTADALCEIGLRMLAGIQVHEEQIFGRLKDYTHLFETEALMMEGTLQGGSRQDLHEKIRLSTIKGKSSPEIENLKRRTQSIPLSGVAAYQVQRFHDQVLGPFLKKHKRRPNLRSEIQI